jgi:hypothetical protein
VCRRVIGSDDLVDRLGDDLAVLDEDRTEGTPALVDIGMASAMACRRKSVSCSIPDSFKKRRGAPATFVGTA